jgi:proteic killer suppression protein
MDIKFSDSRLQRRCESERDLRRSYGTDCAKKIGARIADLMAATTLEEFRALPGRCHELKASRDGQFALELAGGRRLIFMPAQTCAFEAGRWCGIDAVVVNEIVDYHGGGG